MPDDPPFWLSCTGRTCICAESHSAEEFEGLAVAELPEAHQTPGGESGGVKDAGTDSTVHNTGVFVMPGMDEVLRVQDESSIRRDTAGWTQPDWSKMSDPNPTPQPCKKLFVGLRPDLSLLEEFGKIEEHSKKV